jgi:hypothetical protein
MVVARGRLDVPVVHASETEHRRLLAQRVNASLTKESYDYANDITNVLEFGAAGDGTTDDTAAIQAAAAAALADNKVLLFPSGYTFLSDTITITGDNWRIRIARGCTVKLAADGGVHRLTGLFNLDGANGLLENFGELNGNRSAQTYGQYSRTQGLVYSNSASLNHFVYRNGNVGLITNLKFTGIVLAGTGGFTIDGCRITDGCLPDASITNAFDKIGVGFNASYTTGPITINDFVLEDSKCAGIKIFNDSFDQDPVVINRPIIDYRGLNLPDVGAGSVSGYLGTETYNRCIDFMVNDATIYGPDTLTAGALSEGISFGSTTGLRIYGRGTMSTGIEAGQQNCTHTGFMIDNCPFGITVDDDPVTTILQGSLTKCASAAIWGNSGGIIDADVVVTDCGSNAGHFTPSLRFEGTGAGVQLRAQVVYTGVDFSVYAVYAPATPVWVHDSSFLNLMAGSREVSLHMAGTGSSINDSYFLGKGTTGTCIYWTGDGLRIGGNYFFSYVNPWDTSGGTHALITDNQLHSCTTPAGVTGGTDIIADSQNW